jgi:hypothetical protein
MFNEPKPRLHLVWKDERGKVIRKQIGYIGKWPCFAVFYDGVYGNAYRAVCSLPGMAAQLGVIRDQESAKQRCEEAAAEWIAGLERPANGWAYVVRDGNVN